MESTKPKRELPIKNENKEESVIESNLKSGKEEENNQQKGKKGKGKGKGCCGMGRFKEKEECIEFFKELRDNESFREEFISFLSTFIVTIITDETIEPKVAFLNSLKSHTKIMNHKLCQRFLNEKLDTIFDNFPQIINFIKSIDPNNLHFYVNSLISFIDDRLNNRPFNGQFPMFLFPFIPLMTFFTNPGIPQFGPPPPHHSRGPPPHPPHPHPPHPHPHPHHRFHHGRHRHAHGHGHRGWNRRGRHHHGRWNGSRNQHSNGHGRRRGDEVYIDVPIQGYNGPMQEVHLNVPIKEFGLKVELIDSNITLGDNAVVLPNQNLIKEFKFKNIGNLPIPKDCLVKYNGKLFNEMINGTQFKINDNQIDIAQEFIVSIAIESPNNAGKYNSKWILLTKNNIRFGPELNVEFTVLETKNQFKNEKLNSNNNNNENVVESVLNNIENEEFDQIYKNEVNENEFKNEQIEINQVQNQIQNENENSNSNELEMKIEEPKVEKLENNENLPKKEESNEPNEINDKNSDSDGFVEIIEEEPKNEGNINNNNDGIAPELPKEDSFIYETELNQLFLMGFDDESKLKSLLIKNKGNVMHVVENLI